MTPVKFFSANPAPPLSHDEIHLWFFPLCDIDPATATPKLDAAALQFKHEAIVRRLLGAYLDRGAETLIFQRNSYGKPFLVDMADLTFNLSHSAAALMIAVTRDRPIGVDLEYTDRERPFMRLAKRFFCDTEFRALSLLKSTQQKEAFLRLWTCKEALLKAVGRGLAFGLNRLEFEIFAGRPQRLVRIDPQAGSITDWQFLNFSPSMGYCGAVAWHGKPLRISGFCFIG